MNTLLSVRIEYDARPEEAGRELAMSLMKSAEGGNIDIRRISAIVTNDLYDLDDLKYYVDSLEKTPSEWMYIVIQHVNLAIQVEVLRGDLEVFTGAPDDFLNWCTKTNTM